MSAFDPEEVDHITDGSPCPCHPLTICAVCSATGPCHHGPERPEVVVHNERTPQAEGVH